jgi:DNA-binding transcriptional MerR regulator
MQALGFSLREIRELGNLLTAKVAEVRTKMRELERLESELVADLRKCNTELKHRRQHAPGACPVLEASGGREK